MTRILSWALIVPGCLSVVLLAGALAGAQGERRILMLHAYNFMHKATSQVGASARERLLERSHDKLVIDADFLDLIRNATPDKQEEMAHHLARKYSGLPLDLVMTIGGEAFPFFLKYRDIIAPRVDVNALRHWNLSESNLPQGTQILFREPSLWQRHRNIVLGTLLVIAILLALVALLLLQRHRRRKIQEALRTSEERMAFAAKSVNAGPWQYDPEKKQFWGTDHCRALLGLDGDAPVTPARLLGTLDPDQRHVVRAFLGGRGGACGPHGLDLRVSQPDGSIRWLSVRSQSRPGDTDGPLSGIVVDIADRKIAEAEISARRQEVTHPMRVSLLGELSGAIAHEINQPLAAVQSNAHAALDMIQDRPIELGELRDTLTDIVNENSRASEVVTRLRHLLKRGEVRTETMDINGLIEETVKLVGSDAASRGMTLRHSLAEGLPRLEGDAIQIQQVRLNLLMNAMDSTLQTTDRLVAITTDLTAAGEVRIRMADTGSGIGPNDLHRVFEPFYTTKAHGLGLGLSICMTIVQSHGGHLVVENGPERGAVATLLLPVAAAHVPAC